MVQFWNRSTRERWTHLTLLAELRLVHGIKPGTIHSTGCERDLSTANNDETGGLRAAGRTGMVPVPDEIPNQINQHTGECL